MKKVLLILILLIPTLAFSMQGDVNCDGSINIGDAVALISYIFSDVSLPNCSQAYSDSTIIIDTVFASGESFRIVEYRMDDTSSIARLYYGSVAPSIPIYTYRVWQSGILCDSVKYMDVTQRIRIHNSPDDTFPQSCGDLMGILLRADSTSMKVWWRIPGNLHQPTIALEYDLRYSIAKINASNFVLASQIQNEPDPAGTIAGDFDGVRVTGLTPRTTYYFGLKYRINGTVWSPVSTWPAGGGLGVPALSHSR